LSPKEKAEHFRTLHVRKAVGAVQYLGSGQRKGPSRHPARTQSRTGSWSVANANGYADGERVPLDFAIDNLLRIVQAVDLPVTVDLGERFMARTPQQ